MGLFNKSAATEEETPSAPAVKELLPPKVTLGDTINHKRYLDEAVIKVCASTFFFNGRGLYYFFPCSSSFQQLFIFSPFLPSPPTLLTFLPPHPHTRLPDSLFLDTPSPLRMPAVERTCCPALARMPPGEP